MYQCSYSWSLHMKGTWEPWKDWDSQEKSMLQHFTRKSALMTLKKPGEARLPKNKLSKIGLTLPFHEMKSTFEICRFGKLLNSTLTKPHLQCLLRDIPEFGRKLISRPAHYPLQVARFLKRKRHMLSAFYLLLVVTWNSSHFNKASSPVQALILAPGHVLEHMKKTTVVFWNQEPKARPQSRLIEQLMTSSHSKAVDCAPQPWRSSQYGGQCHVSLCRFDCLPLVQLGGMHILKVYICAYNSLQLMLWLYILIQLCATICVNNSWAQISQPKGAVVYQRLAALVGKLSRVGSPPHDSTMYICFRQIFSQKGLCIFSLL